MIPLSLKHKWVLVTALSAASFFLIGLLVSSQLPKVRAMFILEVDRLSNEHLPIRIIPGQVGVRLFPLGIVAENVRLIPKSDSDISKTLSPISIAKIQTDVSILNLIQGRLILTSLEVTGADLQIRKPKATKAEKPMKLEGLFASLAKIPVRRVALNEVNLQMTDTDNQVQYQLEGLHLLINRVGAGYDVETQLPGLVYRDLNSKILFRLSLELEGTVGRNLLKVDRFVLRRGDSASTLAGRLDGDLEALRLDKAIVKAQIRIQLDSAHQWLSKALGQNRKLPDFGGLILADIDLDAAGQEIKSLTVGLQTENLNFEKAMIGNIKGKLVGDPKEIRSDELKITHPGASGSITNLHVQLEHAKGASQFKPDKVSAQWNLKLDELDLFKLLPAVDVKNVPVWLNGQGTAPCEADFYPNFLLQCKPDVQVKNLLVKAETEGKFDIVALPQGTMKGLVSFDAKRFAFSTEVRLPNSKGRSDGQVIYDHGFKIAFEADELAIKDLTTIAGLKMEGSAKLKGLTQGNSDTATFGSSFEFRDFWLDDYWLGSNKGQANYANGFLTFSDIQGYQTVSRYSADVSLNLKNDTISLQGRSPFFDAKDMLQTFSRKVKLPIAITGTGQATVRGSGPLEFSRLSYDLKSQLFRGTVAGESFDQIVFDVKSNNGHVVADRAFLVRGDSSIQMQARAEPNGQLEALIKARKVRLEELNLTNRMGAAATGLIEGDMSLKGYILKPDVGLIATMSQASLAEVPMGNSTLNMKIHETFVEGHGSLFDGIIKGNFQYPLTEKTPFVLQSQIENWNYAPLFNAWMGSASRRDFVGLLTAKIDLRAPTGGPSESTGTIHIDRLSLARGTVNLQNVDPIDVSLRNGQVEIKDFQLRGEKSSINITHRTNSTNKLDLDAQGKLELNILSSFTPFLEDLRGNSTFKFNLRNSGDRLSLVGSAFIENGYAKPRALPHAFEDVSSDISFNQEKISFNSIRSKFAAGRMQGSGELLFKGSKNLPLKISGVFEKVALNIPDGYHTNGSGDFSLTGNWLPLTLKLDYDIRDGLISKEFLEASGGTTDVQKSPYLPKAMREEAASPILLDVHVRIPQGINVKNTFVDGKVKGDLTVHGDPRKPSVLGTVDALPDLKIVYKDRTFEVATAQLKFNDPKEVDPQLYVSARTRYKDYDISLLLQGRASKPEPQLSSVPPLPEPDLLTLLAIGTSNQGLEKASSSAQSAATTQLIADQVFSKTRLAKELKDRFGIDLQFSPGVDGTDKISASKFIFNKKVSDKVELSASTDSQQEKEGKVRYRLNDKVSVIGTVTGRENDSTTTGTKSTDSATTTLGLDLEYKLEFK